MCFRFFCSFIVFSGGRGVCLAIVGGHWHGLRTISSDGGAVKPENACFCMCVMPHTFKTLFRKSSYNCTITTFELKKCIHTICFPILLSFFNWDRIIQFWNHQLIFRFIRSKENLDHELNTNFNVFKEFNCSRTKTNHFAL